jgi:hypothetical protein
MSEEQGSESVVSRSQSIKEEEMAKEKQAPRKLSRKDFVKGAAAVAGAGALASCAPAATPAPTTAPGETAAPAPTCPPAAECATPWLPEAWDEETDVVVVGAAHTGLAGAIEAKNAGLDVLLLERMDHVGGLCIGAGGHSVLGATHVQAAAGIEDTKEWWYEDEMISSDYRAVPELVRTYVDRGEEFVQWMENLGFVWMMVPSTADGHGIADKGHRLNRSHWGDIGIPPIAGSPIPFFSGWKWIEVLKKEVDRLEVPILLEHRMTRIYREPDGPVVGVEVETSEGNINIKARKGVILTAGGYESNDRMCAAQDPRLAGDSYPMGLAPEGTEPYVENTGDAILAAQDVGADLADMGFVAFLSVRYGTKLFWRWEPRDWVNPPWLAEGKLYALPGGVSLGGQAFQRVIQVKADGARYVNEWLGGQLAISREVGIDHYAGPSMNVEDFPEHPYQKAFLNLSERPRNSWVVTDAEGAAAMNWSEADMRNPDSLANGMYPDMVAVEDTLAELASSMGIPADALEATVSRYNGFVDAGVDEDFGKPQPLYKIATPPFFAAKVCLNRFMASGGIRVNTKAQVIERSDQWDGYGNVSIDEEKVIPHLYAVGESAAYTGYRRAHGKLGISCIFGRIAAQNAAKETPLE